MPPSWASDVAIIGGGAAGLMTAISFGVHAPGRSCVLFDGAKRLGAKILVAGGGRCNVTHRAVSAADFAGGNPKFIKTVLAALPVARTLELFRDWGVPLKLEPTGKYFPTTDRAQTVLDALLSAATRGGATCATEHRVEAVEPRAGGGFRICTSRGDVEAGRVVLATGGQSLPKTGSDGFGYELARRLGHGFIATTPALVPMLHTGEFHATLSGVTHDVEIALQAPGQPLRRMAGSLLWTHFGVSGPVVLDASRHWLRARLERRPLAPTLNFAPGLTFDQLERRWLEQAGQHPRAQVATILRAWAPGRVADALLVQANCASTTPIGQQPRESRRTLLHALTQWPLPWCGDRGYNYAEATAGGIPVDEVDPRTMESRVCPGLTLVGEILDVDGRIGGFNFQWAWASGWQAGRALAAALEQG